MIDIKNLRFTFELSPLLGDVLYLLLTQKFVSTEELAVIFANPRVGMYRLRSAIATTGINIQVRNKLGYFLDEANKQAIIDMVNATDAPPTEKDHADA